jgi:THO complex subunit 2
MSGDEPLGNSSISDAQFASLAGGPELVREGLYETREAFTKPIIVEASIAVRDAGAQTKAAAPTKRSLKRLVDALRATGLAVPTWIALAQARQGSLAQMEAYPAKAMAKGFDDVCLPTATCAN